MFESNKYIIIGILCARMGVGCQELSELEQEELSDLRKLGNFSLKNAKVKENQKDGRAQPYTEGNAGINKG